MIYHKEYEAAGLAAYEAAAAAARVPLYQRLVDPFTAEEALWEFENLFVLSGQTGGRWERVSSLCEDLLSAVRRTTDVRQTSVRRDPVEEAPDGNERQTQVYRTREEAARKILDEARSFASYCATPIARESGVAA